MIFIKDSIKSDGKVVFNFSVDGTTPADVMQSNGKPRQVAVTVQGVLDSTSAANVLNLLFSDLESGLPTITASMIVI